MEQLTTYIQNLLVSWPPWAQTAGILTAALLAGLIFQYILLRVLMRLVKRSETFIGSYSFHRHVKGPVKVLIPLIFVWLVFPLLSVSEQFGAFVKNGLSFFLIGATAWLLIRLVHLVESVILGFYKVDVSDNLEARKIHTQIRYLTKVIVVVVLVLAVGTMLMQFEKVRQFGAGILASAGIAGIVVGLAAQRSIANFLLGIQIAVTQPIRIDDVVIIENEWGWIEEINATYVVVRLWDWRRLIVPLTYFTEKPFQNWTRVSASLIGAVYIHVDYATPVDAVRESLHRILKSSQLWDGKVWGLQVTNTSEQTMELRALMSAETAPRAWDLRCEVREKLIAFLQTNYPENLPRIRAEINQKKKGAKHDDRGYHRSFSARHEA